MRQPHVARRIRTTALVVLSLVVLTFSGYEGSAPVEAAAQEQEALRIEVVLDEYSFSPDPLRIPAGRPVTLVIRNVGRFPHEFMAGREPAGDDFEQDLFADLHVNIEKVEMDHADHGSEAAAQREHAEHPPAEHEHGATDDAHDDHEQEAAGGHVHGEGHEHGTMVENQPGETHLMSFTLPESRRGEWTTGCFLPGHYDAGMHGTLIVE